MISPCRIIRIPNCPLPVSGHHQSYPLRSADDGPSLACSNKICQETMDSPGTPSNNPNMVLIPTFFQHVPTMGCCCCSMLKGTAKEPVGINGINRHEPQPKISWLPRQIWGTPGPPGLSHCEFGKPLPKFLKEPPQLVVIPAKKVASARVLGLELVRWTTSHSYLIATSYLFSPLVGSHAHEAQWYPKENHSPLTNIIFSSGFPAPHPF